MNGLDRLTAEIVDISCKEHSLLISRALMGTLEEFYDDPRKRWIELKRILEKYGK